MSVGTLVKWQDADGNSELGVVVDNEGDGRVLVFFPEDDGNSFVSIDNLEVICK